MLVGGLNRVRAHDGSLEPGLHLQDFGTQMLCSLCATPTTSKCTGSCATYWPPVTGPATAGAGVTGTLAPITRSDGTTQATYVGHPLYTYVADTGPGQNKGNGLNTRAGCGAR